MFYHRLPAFFAILVAGVATCASSRVRQMTSKILVADDSITIQKIVAMAFEHEDTVVEGASNGKDAFSRLAEFKPDIVLADVDMPGLNGFELSKRIKDSIEFSRIPVLLLASDYEEFNNELFRYSRADDRISKPFKSEEIIEKVKARLLAAHAVDNGQATPVPMDDGDGMDDDDLFFELSDEHLIEEPGQGLMASGPAPAPVREEPAADLDDEEALEAAETVIDESGIDFDLGLDHLVDEEETDDLPAAVDTAGEDNELPFAGETLELTSEHLAEYYEAAGESPDEPAAGELKETVEPVSASNEDDALAPAANGASPASLLDDLFAEEADEEGPAVDFHEVAVEPAFDEGAFLASENALDEKGGETPEDREQEAAPHKIPPRPSAGEAKSFDDLMRLVEQLAKEGDGPAWPAPKPPEPKKTPEPTARMPETAAVIDRVIHDVDTVKEATLSEEARAPEAKGEPPEKQAVSWNTRDRAEEAERASLKSESPEPVAEPPAPKLRESAAEDPGLLRRRELKEIARSLEEEPVARLDDARIKRVLENSLEQAIKTELEGFSEAVLQILREVVREVAAEAIKAAVREEMEKISKWRSE